MNKDKYNKIRTLLNSCTRVELDNIKGVVACLFQAKGFEQDLERDNLTAAGTMINKITVQTIKAYAIIFLVISSIGMLTFTVFGMFLLDLALYLLGVCEVIFCVLVIRLANQEIKRLKE